MRILQTIGTTDGVGPRPFRYRRTSHGIEISILGNAGFGSNILLPEPSWRTLLERIETSSDPVFGVTQETGSFYKGQIFSDLFHGLDSSFGQIDSGYIAAILLHEGSVRLHHGQLPSSSFAVDHRHPFEARVYLRRSHP
jgi:hypothetical protein